MYDETPAPGLPTGQLAMPPSVGGFAEDQLMDFDEDPRAGRARALRRAGPLFVAAATSSAS
jgi:hypothetical protein